MTLKENENIKSKDVLRTVEFNSLPKNKILDMTKLKADDKCSPNDDF